MNRKPCKAWQSNILACSGIDTAGKMEGVLLTSWLIRYYKNFQPSVWLSPLSLLKAKTFSIQALFIQHTSYTISYGLSFIGRLYAKFKCNLLPCHDIPHWLQSLGEEHQTRLNKQLGHKTEMHCLCIGSKACCKDFSCLPISPTLIALVSHSREQ